MKNTKLIYIAVSIIVVIGAAIYLHAPRVNTPELVSPAPALNQSPSPPLSPSASSSNKPAPVPQPAQNSQSSGKVTTPAQNDEWVIGENHTIRWSKTLVNTASMYLVNANNGSVVGWITPNIDTNQTSYSWNTKDVFLSSSSGLKKELQTGRYIIKIQFNRKPPIEIQSASFSIIYPSQVTLKTYIAAIKNYVFVPSSLTVKQRDTVTFTNNDQVIHKLIPSSVGNIYTLNPGESGTLDTTTLAPGSYGYSSEVYPTAKFTLTITTR